MAKKSKKGGKGQKGKKAPMSLREVVAALEAMAPCQLAESWDNVGLLAGDLDAEVRAALLCIDLMPAVVDEAIAAEVELVIAYHPPIFRPVTRLVTPGPDMEAGVFRCIRRGIAIYSPHTSLDVATGGTNDVLADLCGATETTPLGPVNEDGLGIGRVGRLRDPATLRALAKRLKRKGGADHVSLVGNPDATIERVVICVGAAGSLPFSLDLGPGDAIVTGEIRHHDALRIQRLGTNAIALSHWSSERPTLAVLQQRLSGELPALAFSLSRADREPFLRV